MAPTPIRTCPKCELRFRASAELEDHLDRDHGVALRRPWELSDDDIEHSEAHGTIAVAVNPEKGMTPALEVATAVARQAQMDVDLVAVTPSGLPDQSTEAFLVRCQADVELAGVDDVEHHRLVDGDVASAILGHLGEHPVSLLCMDTHARGALAEMLLGSVSETIVRRSPAPTMLVGPHVTPRPEGYQTLVVGMDGSHTSAVALDAAAVLAQELGATLHLIQVVNPKQPDQPEALDQLAYLHQSAKPLPDDTTVEVVDGPDPATAILDLAKRRPEALVVLGTHGWTGLQRFTIGSVALDVVRKAPGPVVVVDGLARVG